MSNTPKTMSPLRLLVLVAIGLFAGLALIGWFSASGKSAQDVVYDLHHAQQR